MSLLSKPWQLEDVNDVERLCRTLLKDISQHFQEQQREDCVADLIGRTWELYVGWNSEQTPSFRQYLTWRLREYELPNLARYHLGRSIWQFSDSRHERERPSVLSLNAGERSLEESESVRSSLPAPDSLAALRRRVVADRDSKRAEDKRTIIATLAKAA